MVSPPSVVVEAPARLHMGFLDAERAAGRQFGGLGLTITGLATRIVATPADAGLAEPADRTPNPRVSELVEAMRGAYGIDGEFSIQVESLIPEHAGLGSGTQLALAVGTAIARLCDFEVSASGLAQRLGRGKRSGIGIGAFEQGGFLVDGGSTSRGAIAPIVSRLAFPSQWRVLLIFDRSVQGLHGSEESGAFRALPVLPESISAHLCRLVLLRALPSLQNADIIGFGAAISELQRIIGDHFAPAQGGRYASPRVAQTLAWLASQDVPCVGQSSWGPTGFAIVDGEMAVQEIMSAAQERWREHGELHFMACEGRNRGGQVWVRDAQTRAAPGARPQRASIN